jgi:hypothetical protein
MIYTEDFQETASRAMRDIPASIPGFYGLLGDP